MPARINHLAVVVAAIAFFMFGALWFTVLSEPWKAALGKPMGDASLGPWVFVLSFLTGLVLAYGTAIALSRRPEDLNPRQGASFGIFMGLIVYGAMSFDTSLYEARSWMLWLIDTAYVVIGFAIVGAIIGAWKPKADA